MEWSKLNILIVEDDINIAIDTEMLIVELGSNVAGHVDNGKDAIQFVKDTPPDLILMDIDLKGNLNGLEIGEAIKDTGIPIIFITSHFEQDYYDKAQLSNIVGYLVKPANKLSLRTIIQMAMTQIEDRKELEKKTISEKLLMNILPESAINELIENGETAPKTYKSASVLFTDFIGYTKISEQLSPQEILEELNSCYSVFDEICKKYNIEKIKTIGDSYMAVGGIPIENETHMFDIVNAALEMQNHIKNCKAEGKPLDKMRIGIHTGEVIAGVVGTNKLAYDVWGETVNMASRIENKGRAGHILMSHTTYKLLNNQFQAEEIKSVYLKGIGNVNLYEMKV